MLGLVADDREEGTPNEVFYRRDDAPTSQKLFRRESNERPARTLISLRAQHVEMVGRGRRLADPHVVLRTQLEIPLDSRGGMVGPLAFVSVGKEEHERRMLVPLLLGG